MVAGKLLDIRSGSITFEKILSILWVLESIAINIMSIRMTSYSGCLYSEGINELEARDSKNSFI